MRKSIDLAAALASVEEQPAQELTLAELVRAYSLTTLDGTDVRLRKWVAAFGAQSAWTVTSEQLETAAHAMLEHGYKPSASNRDLSSLGSVYRWAKAKRLAPRGFRSPTFPSARPAQGLRSAASPRTHSNALRRSCE